MRPVTALGLAASLALASLGAGPAFAAVQPVAGLPQGFSLSLGVTGAALDGSLGPVTLGLGVNGGQAYYPPMSMGGYAGGALNPNAWIVWTTRHDDALDLGWVAAAYYPMSYTYSPGAIVQGSRTLLGDAGLTLRYHLSLPPLMGYSLALIVSPTVTFALDGSSNVVFGPHSGIEVAARLHPDIDLTIGGGTGVGVRFRL